MALDPLVYEKSKPFTVLSGQTVRLGRLVEGGAATIREAQADSETVVGVAYSAQAKSVYQSDGVTARADGTVYAGETVAVGLYGVYWVPENSGGSSGIVTGDLLVAAADGTVDKFDKAADNEECIIGRAVSEITAINSVNYVQIKLSL
jgi:hypothetical protein